ncbi:hypothetical protein [Kitasatospora sp. NPDC057936]|uniref:hypothetical protein n=1 Tax=Kitasatospora sp. NPDC057936 TaxID=3346283 RepID=UPI0036DDAB75
MSSTDKPAQPSGTLFDHAPDDLGPGHCPACRQPRNPLFPTAERTHRGPWTALCARCWSQHHRTGKRRDEAAAPEQGSLW